MPLLVILVALGLAVLGVAWRRRATKADRERYINTYAWPAGLLDKLAQKRPELTPGQCALVGRGLRQFFHAHARSGQFVSMPSQVADDLWHEFILHTRNYDQFCRRAFGRFMHHTPAVALGRRHQNNAGLRRTWWHCCQLEKINPSRPTRLPLLFALDTQLGIVGGFIYHPQCDKLHKSEDGSTVHCGGDFSSSSVDGSTEGFGDSGSGSSGFSGSDSGDSGSSGGDGGSSCGGGCGGGD